MSSVGSYTAHAERPERSRNAKAQARHRAKRKAYIEQLEQTVTKLQIASGCTNEHVSALPPPLLKIRELEQENSRLQKENDELRRLLTDPNSRNLPYESSRRLGSAHQDSRNCDREDYLKRRKSGHQEGVYLSPSETPPHGPESNSRAPPALTIPNVPQQIPHSYLSSNSNGHGASQGGPLYPFQMPNTPSGSSATSSPPFSPTQMQTSTQLPLDQRQHISGDSHHLSNYSQSASHYNSVKVEDDHYHSGAQSHSSIQYPYSSTHSQSHANMDWHGYSSERAHLHR